MSPVRLFHESEAPGQVGSGALPQAPGLRRAGCNMNYLLSRNGLARVPAPRGIPAWSRVGTRRRLWRRRWRRREFR